MTTAILIFLIFFITACVYVFGFRMGCAITSKLVGNIVVNAIRDSNLQVANKDVLICKILKDLKNWNKGMNNIICGEYKSIGKLEYWLWSIPFYPKDRKHLVGKFYWRID